MCVSLGGAGWIEGKLLAQMVYLFIQQISFPWEELKYGHSMHRQEISHHGREGGGREGREGAGRIDVSFSPLTE